MRALGVRGGVIVAASSRRLLDLREA
ncbi:MAG: hypothetical protein ACI9WU_001083, partial [Myxococcota bacterium]